MKDAMCLKGNGCGTMCHILIIQKKAALSWLNRLLARGMGGLIPSIRIGGGSLMDAISQGKVHYLDGCQIVINLKALFPTFESENSG
jgi:hypothetical protein